MTTVNIVDSQEAFAREVRAINYTDGALEGLAYAAEDQRRRRRLRPASGRLLDRVTTDRDIQARTVQALARTYFGADDPAYELASVFGEQVIEGRLDWHPAYWYEITGRARKRLALDLPIIEQASRNAAFLRKHGVDTITLAEGDDGRNPITIAQSINMMAAILRRDLGIGFDGDDGDDGDDDSQ
jgi:hypothetical protein